MQGFVTLLPRPYFEQVKLLWDGLEDRFGLSFIHVTPIPHFSWQIGEGYQIEAVLSQLSQLTKSLAPYEVRVRGVEVFPGDLPVVYLKVLRTAHIRALHRKFWSALTLFTDQPKLLYAPGSWQPHVTLALNDLTNAALPELVQWVKQFKIDWAFTCYDFSLVGQYEDGLTCIEASFECGQGLVATDGCAN
jgi:2'-5' RNA ligase